MATLCPKCGRWGQRLWSFTSDPQKRYAVWHYDPAMGRAGLCIIHYDQEGRDVATVWTTKRIEAAVTFVEEPSGEVKVMAQQYADITPYLVCTLRINAETEKVVATV